MPDSKEARRTCSPPVVLGVDGGGTKTHYALFDVRGRPVDFSTSGPTNHESLPDGFTGLRCRLEEDLDALLSRNGLTANDVANAAFGLAGVDTRRQHGIISAILHHIGMHRFILCNDSFLGVKAGCVSGYGICAINGTGFSVGGIDRHGCMLQVGGLGELTGDEGGGGILSQRVIRAIYDHLYKDTPATLLQDLLFHRLGITDSSDYPELLLEALAEGRCQFAEIGRIVFEAADQCDAVALEILDHSGREYARSIQGVLERLDFGSREQPLPLELVLAGSVFVKGSNPRIIRTMSELLAAWNPTRKITLSTLSSPPVLGAVLWALEAFEIPDCQTLVKDGLAALLENEQDPNESSLLNE